MLCVDLKALKADPDRIQKDIDLAHIVDAHTRLFPSRGDAIKAGYAPLAFNLSIRTTYTNQVVSIAGDPVRYYTSVLDGGDDIISGWDRIIKVSSTGVFQVCECSTALQEVMTKFTQFQPIGLANVRPGKIDPVIYSHVILADEGAELFKQCLKPGNRLVPIQSIDAYGNLLPLLDTLIIVDKEEDHA